MCKDENSQSEEKNNLWIITDWKRKIFDIIFFKILVNPPFETIVFKW